MALRNLSQEAQDLRDLHETSITEQEQLQADIDSRTNLTILTSEDGSQFYLTVANDGTLTTTAL